METLFNNLIICPKIFRRVLKKFKVIPKASLILGLALASCGSEMERAFYQNGKLKFEVPLKDGRRNGKMTMYYENGETKETSFWKDGYEEGEVIIYYDNGAMMQKQNLHHGTVIGETHFFRMNGTLSETRYFDSLGRVIDYKKFNTTGQQDMDVSTRRAIIIENEDTVRLGNFYEAWITLGNRRFDNIEVVLAKPGDPDILKYPRLPKKDSKSALLQIKADSVGPSSVEGVIIEFDPARNDSFLIVPFKHIFMVKE